MDNAAERLGQGLRRAVNHVRGQNARMIGYHKNAVKLSLCAAERLLHEHLTGRWFYDIL